MSLTKNDRNPKKSINILRKSPLTDRQEKYNPQALASDGNELFFLPKIERRLAQKALLQPTSLITRYLSDYSNSVIKETEEDMKRPIKIPASSLKKININKKNFKFLFSENDKNKNCITERLNTKNVFSNEQNLKKMLKNKTSNTYITDLNVKEENGEEDKKSENNNDSNSVNDNKINENKNNNNINYLSQNIPKKIDYPSAMNIDHLMSFEKCNKLNKLF